MSVSPEAKFLAFVAVVLERMKSWEVPKAVLKK
jgi:hypothetical protein